MGVHSSIIGICQISDDHLKWPLVQNYFAAQVALGRMTQKVRKWIEESPESVKDVKKICSVKHEPQTTLGSSRFTDRGRSRK